MIFVDTRVIFAIDILFTEEIDKQLSTVYFFIQVLSICEYYVYKNKYNTRTQKESSKYLSSYIIFQVLSSSKYLIKQNEYFTLGKAFERNKANDHLEYYKG